MSSSPRAGTLLLSVLVACVPLRLGAQSADQLAGKGVAIAQKTFSACRLMEATNTSICARPTAAPTTR